MVTQAKPWRYRTYRTSLGEAFFGRYAMMQGTPRSTPAVFVCYAGCVPCFICRSRRVSPYREGAAPPYAVALISTPF